MGTHRQNCALTMVAETPESLPRKLGPYELLESIGRGGMGEVFRARLSADTGFEKSVAIKCLDASLNATRARDRFIHEATFAAALHHPNLVEVFEFGESESGELYIVMEHIVGSDLRQVLRMASQHDVRIPPWFSLWGVIETLRGLAFLHALTDSQGRLRNVIHRDVSPSNVFISERGDIKLGDFGIVKDDRRSFKTTLGKSLGKLGYMAPEQLKSRAIDHRVDIFSAGVVLWEMLAQRRLFGDKPSFVAMLQLDSDHRPRASSFFDDVPLELDDILFRALARDPEQRFPSATAFADSLSSVLSDLRVSVRTTHVAEIVQSVSGSMPAQSRLESSKISDFARQATSIGPNVPTPEVTHEEGRANGTVDTAAENRETPHRIPEAEVSAAARPEGSNREGAPAERSLADVLRAESLSLSEVLHVARQLASALDSVHLADIPQPVPEPSRILLETRDAEPRYRVTSFSPHPLEDIGAGESKEACGIAPKWSYIAPERAREAATVDVRADVYAFGAMLFEMLCGRPPFIGATTTDLVRQHEHAPVPSMHQFRAGLPLKLEGLCRTCLAKDPVLRYGSMSAVLLALDQIPNTTRAVLEPSKLPEPCFARSRRRQHPSYGRLALSAVLFFALLSLVVLVAQRPRWPSRATYSSSVALPGEVGFAATRAVSTEPGRENKKAATQETSKTSTSSTAPAVAGEGVSSPPAEVGMLRLQSSGPGLVSIDGRVVGSLPLDGLPLLEGSHEVVITTLRGHKKRLSIRIRAGATSMYAVEPSP